MTVVPDRLNSEYAVVLQSFCSQFAAGVQSAKACTRCNGESFQRDNHPTWWRPTLAASWPARLSQETERSAGDCAKRRISDAPAGPSLSSWRSVTWKNCARTQRCHGVTRIVTISCTDSDDARWRRPLAQKCGNDWRRKHHEMVHETSWRQINTCAI